MQSVVDVVLGDLVSAKVHLTMMSSHNRDHLEHEIAALEVREIILIRLEFAYHE